MEHLRYFRIDERDDEVAIMVFVDGGGASTRHIKKTASVREVVIELRLLAETLERTVADRERKLRR